MDQGKLRLKKIERNGNEKQSVQNRQLKSERGGPTQNIAKLQLMLIERVVLVGEPSLQAFRFSRFSLRFSHLLHGLKKFLLAKAIGGNFAGFMIRSLKAPAPALT